MTNSVISHLSCVHALAGAVEAQHVALVAYAGLKFSRHHGGEVWYLYRVPVYFDLYGWRSRWSVDDGRWRGGRLVGRGAYVAVEVGDLSPNRSSKSVFFFRGGDFRVAPWWRDGGGGGVSINPASLRRLAADERWVMVPKDEHPPWDARSSWLPSRWFVQQSLPGCLEVGVRSRLVGIQQSG